jgi:hypothetical protein
MKPGDPAGQSTGVPYNYLCVFDGRLNTLSSRIQVEGTKFPGLLIGADAAGHLYFARLVTSEGGAILRVRLN